LVRYVSAYLFGNKLRAMIRRITSLLPAASGYPHSDSAWPDSMPTLAETAAGTSTALLQRVVHDNVRELFHLDLH
jgi:hypothetical protein